MAAAVLVAARPVAPRRLLVATTASAVLLDVDAIGRPFGFGDIAALGGHRGITHSLPFAVAMAALVVRVAFLAPFVQVRYKAPWQPLRGVVFEMVGVWIPAMVVVWAGCNAPARTRPSSDSTCR